MNKNRQIELPSLEEAKRITKEIKRPIGHKLVLLNCVAPNVTQSGITLSDAMTKQHQEQLNKKGMLVVHSPFKRDKDSLDVNEVFEGERVIFSQGTQASFIKVVTSDKLVADLELEEGQGTTPNMYQKYVVMVVNTHDIAVVVE